jgi:pilus assembly protein CpaF
LQALNTGHAGTLSTIHANSAEQALSRFASCVLQADVDMPYAAIRISIAECLQLVVHLERHHGERQVRQIVRLRGYDVAADRYVIEEAP